MPKAKSKRPIEAESDDDFDVGTTNSAVNEDDSSMVVDESRADIRAALAKHFKTPSSCKIPKWTPTSYQNKTEVTIRIASAHEMKSGYDVEMSGIIIDVNIGRVDLQHMFVPASHGMSTCVTAGHRKFASKVNKTKSDDKSAYKNRLIYPSDGVNVGLLHSFLRIRVNKTSLQLNLPNGIDSKSENWEKQLIGETICFKDFDALAYRMKPIKTDGEKAESSAVDAMDTDMMTVKDVLGPVTHNYDATSCFTWLPKSKDFFESVQSSPQFNATQAFSIGLNLSFDAKDEVGAQRVAEFKTCHNNTFNLLADEIDRARINAIHKEQPEAEEIASQLEQFSSEIRSTGAVAEVAEKFQPFEKRYKGKDAKQLVTLLNSPDSSGLNSFQANVTDIFLPESERENNTPLPPFIVINTISDVNYDSADQRVSIGWEVFIFDTATVQKMAPSFTTKYIQSETFTPQLPTGKTSDEDGKQADYVSKVDLWDVSNSVGNPQTLVLTKLLKKLPRLPLACTVITSLTQTSSYVGEFYLPWKEILASPKFAIPLSPDWVDTNVCSGKSKFNLTVGQDDDDEIVLNKPKYEKTSYEGLAVNGFLSIRKTTFQALQTKVDAKYPSKKKTFHFSVVLFDEYDTTPFMEATDQSEIEAAFEQYLQQQNTTLTELLENADAGLWAYIPEFD